jgi:hypothetical protein
MKKPERARRYSGMAEENHRLNASLDEEGVSTLGKLRALDDIPEREPARIEAGREKFLIMARKTIPAVSKPPKSRLIGWTNIFKKERSPMLTLARIVLLAAFALGGTGVTAYAAQESLPDQALYPVKTWIEDVRLSLTKDPQTDFYLLEGFVEERIEEIEALVGGGLSVPNQVATRLNTHLQQMVRLAADMDDPALLKSMEQVQVRAQVQVQRLEKLRENAPEDSEALGLATQAMHNMRNTAEDALQDPETFRQRQGANRPEEAPERPNNEVPNGSGESPSNGEGQGPGGPQGPNKKNGAGQ